MKYYESSDIYDHDKYKTQKWNREHKGGGFKCSHCKQFVIINDIMGTANRNHCNICLWSKHVDESKGDRRSTCQGGMRPIGLTFKHEGYGKLGEIMIIHLCSLCGKLSINRIARDDPESTVEEIFDYSLCLEQDTKRRLKCETIDLLNEEDYLTIKHQLYGHRVNCKFIIFML